MEVLGIREDNFCDLRYYRQDKIFNRNLMGKYRFQVWREDIVIPYEVEIDAPDYFSAEKIVATRENASRIHATFTDPGRSNSTDSGSYSFSSNAAPSELSGKGFLLLFGIFLFIYHWQFFLIILFGIGATWILKKYFYFSKTNTGGLQLKRKFHQ
tara:strand:+ start:87 stop:551 length:465 start_codon:yes stop_codon:yes gene_type:complete